jgi:hypothetical protein
MGIPRIITEEQSQLREVFLKNIDLLPPPELKVYSDFSLSFSILEKIDSSATILLAKEVERIDLANKISFSNSIKTITLSDASYSIASKIASVIGSNHNGYVVKSTPWAGIFVFCHSSLSLKEPTGEISVSINPSIKPIALATQETPDGTTELVALLDEDYRIKDGIFFYFNNLVYFTDGKSISGTVSNIGIGL